MIEGLSQREAARYFGIDPRTVRKMLSYSVPPGYVRTRPPVRPKLDPFIGIIDRILEEDKDRPKKQRHTSKRTPARQLRLGITELTALTWLPRFISELRAAYPQLVIETEVALGRNLYDRLQEDMLDVIIVPDAFADPHFTAIHLARVQNVWMGSPKLVSTTGTLSIEKLTEFTLLVQGNRSGTGLWVSKWLQSEAAVVRRHYSSDSLIALLGMTVAGLGVTYLPVPCFASLVSEGKLMIIPTNPELPDIPYVAIYRKDRPNALAAKVANIAHMTCDFSSQLSDCFE